MLLPKASWALRGENSMPSHQLTTDEGPKLPNPWLVRRIAELQIANTPRAMRSLLLPAQST